MVPDQNVRSVAQDGGEEDLTLLSSDATEKKKEKRAGLVLRSAEFRKSREHIWRALDDMIGRVEKHLSLIHI